MNNIKLKIIFYKSNKNKVPNKNKIFNWIKNIFNIKNTFFKICILVTNKNIIKKFNFKYKKINNSTNILTFTSNKFYINNNIIIYGDIILCNKIIEKESIKYNINLLSHWAHLIIHSCLHIIGFKHNNNFYFNKMKQKEIEILSNFNFKNPHKK